MTAAVIVPAPSPAPAAKSTPVTVLTGFLGAGKTTLILSILKQLDPNYKVVVLKNEFGDVEVDSLLASSPSIAGVNEILNGCVCCVLVGQMKTALLDIKEQFNPDRIIVESSGSAFPATLAWQIRELERETAGGMTLDAVLTVVDCINFSGYEDTSPTAKMQAKYTDILILNKWDLVSDRQLDTVLDHLYVLNDETPKLRHSPSEPLKPSVLFGLDSRLFTRRAEEEAEFAALGWTEGGHQGEVESVGVYRSVEGGAVADEPADACKGDAACGHDHSSSTPTSTGPRPELNWEALIKPFLDTLPSSIYRVKGLLLLPPPSEGSTSSASITPFSAQPLPTDPSSSAPPSPSPAPESLDLYIVNWAFGRHTLTRLPDSARADPKTGSTDRFKDVELRVTLMGERGEVKKWARKMGQVVDGLVR